jgi:large subunit ribosomal protein L13e
VHGQTIKYNLKKRLGRGFTFEELKVSSRPLLPSLLQAGAGVSTPAEWNKQIQLDAGCFVAVAIAAEPAWRRLPAQEAGIPIKLAATIGIAVDHRRHNRSLEGLQVRKLLKQLITPLPAALPRAGQCASQARMQHRDPGDLSGWADVA